MVPPPLVLPAIEVSISEGVEDGCGVEGVGGGEGVLASSIDAKFEIDGSTPRRERSSEPRMGYNYDKGGEAEIV